MAVQAKIRGIKKEIKPARLKNQKSRPTQKRVQSRWTENSKERSRQKLEIFEAKEKRKIDCGTRAYNKTQMNRST
jgi:hypothetical protein